jgi:hypothetical protein
MFIDTCFSINTQLCVCIFWSPSHSEALSISLSHSQLRTGVEQDVQGVGRTGVTFSLMCVVGVRGVFALVVCGVYAMYVCLCV